MRQLTVIMYHYVRELAKTRYPKIKGLRVSDFKNQLEYLEESYHFVTVEECLEATYNDMYDLPESAVLLTFDDGYKEHFTEVFPLLDERGIQGVFFPPVQAIMEQKVLDVNKIHFILASTDHPKKLMEILNSKITELMDLYDLEEPDNYWKKLGNSEHRYDPPEIVYVKRLLQRELPEKSRKIILDELFLEFVGVSEKVFANELYMSVDQLRCMHHNGMFIGGHGYSHKWLNAMDDKEQGNEIKHTKEFLDEIGVNTKNWVMCYPYGAYNKETIALLKSENCKLGLTTNVGAASLTPDNSFTLERYDTNDLQNLINGQKSRISDACST